MEKLSRQILFETLPDTRHRKFLPKKVLARLRGFEGAECGSA
jgi:hypothetical protein